MNVTLDLRVAGATDSALSFENPDCDDRVWIARSQILNLEDVLDRQLDAHPDDALGVMVTVEVPQWLAEDIGLDHYAEEVDYE